MKQIKLKFVDFNESLNPHDNEFLDILRKRYDVVLCDNPDYIIYGVFGMDHVKYDCIRIFFTGECYTPDFNECDYGIAFDRFQFGDRYLRLPYYNFGRFKPAYQRLKNRKPFTSTELAEKQGFCNFVVSNCFAKQERAIFFDLLSQYKKVDSGGRYKNNIGGAVKDKRAFQQKYKFSIAFENNSHEGYLTEKISEAFDARTIPIYFGDPNVAMDFNAKAFINCHNYNSFDEVIERVKEIDNNDDLYLQMINENPIAQNYEEPDLTSFLYHIFDQNLSDAKRRSKSQTALGFEGIKRRHISYEKYVHTYIGKVRNQIFRLKTGTLLTHRQTK